MNYKYLFSLCAVGLLSGYTNSVSALVQNAAPFVDEQNNLVFSSRYRVESYQRASYSQSQRQKNIKADIIKVLSDHRFTGRKTDISDLPLAFDHRTVQLIQTTLPLTLDPLDILIQQDVTTSQRRKTKKISELSLPFNHFQNLKEVRFFDTLDELWRQGYEIVGRRTRVSEDVMYRRYNIASALRRWGTLRVVSPGEIVRFFEDIEYDPRAKKNYKSGYGLIGNQEVLMYAGGVCGGSTALYQGMLTHRGFKILSKKNHSTRYESYYPALINGVEISTPGLDAMVFEREQDLVFQNIRDYPLIIITSFDGVAGSEESIISLGKPQDQGSLIYDRMYHDKLGRPCYVRKINEEERVSCYRKLVGE